MDHILAVLFSIPPKRSKQLLEQNYCGQSPEWMASSKVRNHEAGFSFLDEQVCADDFIGQARDFLKIIAIA